MHCLNCKQLVTPGAEVIVDDLSMSEAHCPYCLEILPEGDSTPTTGQDDQVTLQRHESRRKIRGQFVDRLLETSSDSSLHCPVCDHSLNKNDEQLLRSKEHFNCHFCSHDLATVAYRKEAYHQQRWLPVVFALGDLQAEKKCQECCYLGAISKACQCAFSWMSGTESKPQKQIQRMLKRTGWEKPDCDWESCFAVKQYRKMAGEALLLL